jgi:Bifunctional DNA primase/polymerase, N-terminal
MASGQHESRLKPIGERCSCYALAGMDAQARGDAVAEELAVSSVRQAALSYASLGLTVIPLNWPTEAGRCSCGCHHSGCWRRAKHPLVPISECSMDPEVIGRWWDKWPLANVGVMARESGLVIVDLDFQTARTDALEAFIAHWGEEAERTVLARSGKGYHLYYRRPDGPRGLFGGKARLGRGQDVLAGEYVVAPPSCHINMNTYRWREGQSIFQSVPGSMPPEMAAELTKRPPFAWYVRNAPFGIADALHLPLSVRSGLRRLARRTGFDA